MQPGNSIEVKNITKKFKVYLDKGSSLKEKMLFKKRNRYEDRWVLKGISFDVKQGEAIGLIGKNGCGKSTTLKMLTRIMYPDSGTINVKGRVSSLIELGAGFHPDMSGRENIYTNAAIFGLSHKEIDSRMQEIIDFSEMEEFLDNPVRTYSSGMYMRLAFAVAINVDADVLLIDEILGVGDVSFQTKCFEKLKEIKAKGTTIVVVSHSLEQIERICDSSIWIEDGTIKEIGEPHRVHEHYLECMEEKRIEKKEEEKKHGKVEVVIPEVTLPQGCFKGAFRSGNQKVQIKKIEFTGSHEGGYETFIRQGFQIKIDYETKIEGLTGKVACSIFRNDNTFCAYTDTFIQGKKLISFQPSGEITLCVIKHHLLKGNYAVHLVLLDGNNEVLDSLQNGLDIQVVADENGEEIVIMEQKWTVNGSGWN